MSTVLHLAATVLIVIGIAGWANGARTKDRNPDVQTRKAAAGGSSGKAAAGGSWGKAKVADRRALWARRYGAGAGWTAGTSEITGASGTDDGVGDPIAGCGGGGGCGGG
jgi:hypothetical protein